jgi:ribosome maturation factor RimP
MDNLLQLKEKIESYLIDSFDNSQLFIAEIKVLPNSKIDVFIDRADTNITIDECAKISRNLENYLETNNLVGEKYILEVSSPGMDQPFKVAQQYQKNINKNIEVLLLDGNKMIGKLLAYTPENITIQTEKKIKKEITTEEKNILLTEIKSIKKHFIFKI